MSNKATAASQIHCVGFQTMKHRTLRLCYGFLQGTQLHHPPKRDENSIHWFRVLNKYTIHISTKATRYLNIFKKEIRRRWYILGRSLKNNILQTYTFTKCYYFMTENQCPFWHKKQNKTSHLTNVLILKKKKKRQRMRKQTEEQRYNTKMKRQNKSLRCGFTVYLKSEWNRQFTGVAVCYSHSSKYINNGKRIKWNTEGLWHLYPLGALSEHR